MTASHICCWPLCIELAESDSPWCGQHRLLAVQHDASHEIEGHASIIEGCPRCLDPDGWKPRELVITQWDEQCPQRGPALTHARTLHDPPGVCAHCGGRFRH